MSYTLMFARHGCQIRPHKGVWNAKLGPGCDRLHLYEAEFGSHALPETYFRKVMSPIFGAVLRLLIAGFYVL